MPADESGTVSVVVITRNSARTLEACLRSIRRQTYPDVEVIVVDNHSTDATSAIAERYADQLRVIGPERSAQRNDGAAVARGRWLFFVDSDMIVDPTVVEEAVAAMRATRIPAAIVPESSFGVGFWSRCRELERSCYAGDDTVEAARFYAREAFIDARGFDETILGGEDWDLSRRVARGRRLPRTSAWIQHDEGRIALGAAYRKRRYYAPGYLRYLRKHRAGASTQMNPLARAAYARHWRSFARHPLLTAGVAVLKSVELAAVLEVAARSRAGVGAAPRPGDRRHPYTASEAGHSNTAEGLFSGG